jgi:hypothetical protein
VAVADDAYVDLALAWVGEDLDPALARLLEVLEANGFVTPSPLADSATTPLTFGELT